MFIYEILKFFWSQCEISRVCMLFHFRYLIHKSLKINSTELQRKNTKFVFYVFGCYIYFVIINVILIWSHFQQQNANRCYVILALLSSFYFIFLLGSQNKNIAESVNYTAQIFNNIPYIVQLHKILFFMAFFGIAFSSLLLLCSF